MKKIDNLVIENQSPEFAVELKKFWERMNEKGLIPQYFVFDYTNTKEALKDFRYYGIANDSFSCLNRNLAEKFQCQIFSHIPTDAELGLEDITFPCDMEVWDKESDKKVKCKVIMTFEHNGNTRFIEFDEAINEYFVYKYAQPIQSLTLSELIQIASEVKGCKVILKEDKA